ncbi:hypothetical protein [Paracoccus sp. MKU1]|uniref:hypothetical protein n=1 Tax=Paracoccus sp. MKU1 TaxID=1745182 RepID=UPI0007192D43|nr:hypothetical protein [Paracoccus sp. MKU1]KRW94332.1 hypothetical protein AQY21_20600 [Paracoccus sp. MKU1]
MDCNLFQIADDRDEEGGHEVFDFSHPEDVMFEVVEYDPLWKKFGWKNFKVDGTLIVSDADVVGAASYENSYGGFLDYTVESLADCPRREGIFVLEDVTAIYRRGDGWTTDDDMDFDAGITRPATIEEIVSDWCGSAFDFWASERENVA